MIPILYDADLADALTISNGIGRLTDTISCKVVEERNGAYTMSLVYPFDGIHAEDLKVQRIIKVKAGDKAGNQCFRIYKVNPTLDGKQITVECNHISYDLSFYPVTPFSGTLQLYGVQTGIAMIFYNSVNGYSPWNIVCEQYDLQNPVTFGTDVPRSVRSMLGGSEGSILDIFGGEYEWDNRTIKWRRERGADNGVTIAYGKNLTSYEQETNIAEVYTGILPYYSYEGTVVYGDVQYSSNQSSFPFNKSVCMDFTNDFQTEGEEPTAPTVAQLNARAQSYISANNVGTPKVSFDIEFYPLWQDPSYKAFGDLDRVGLCDTVTVLFTELGVRTKAKVVKTVYNTLLERYESIELGSVRANIADTISGLMSSSGSGGGSSSGGGGGGGISALDVYPVGSIYMSVNSTSPATLFGGTWERIKDAFLLSAGDTYAAGATGGEATHTLTVDELPSHSHVSFSHSPWNAVPGTGSDTNFRPIFTGSATGLDWTIAVNSGSTGGGQAHNNLPPYLVVYMWQRTA